MSTRAEEPNGRGETAARIRHFVHGVHRLSISSESLAELLGLVESECQAVLEAMAAGGLLRKDTGRGDSPLYCKD